MSDPGYGGQYDRGFGRDGGSADASVAISTLQNIARQIGLLVQAYSGRVVGGTFTLAAATSTVVSDARVTANSIITWGATNATAALTVRTLGLYLATKTAASTFTMSCQNGSATGTETFNYVLFNPS